MTSIDFLRPDTSQIRHQIRGILDSYSHEWDLLSELSQNAIDAIREAGVEKGRVEISIDAANRKISLKDNGIGIDPQQVEKLLRPFGTGKAGKPHLIGEKGVGLKFIIFSSSSFKLSTQSSFGACTASISGAAGWVQSESDETLELNLENFPTTEKCGTKIEVTIADQSSAIFDYSLAELIFLCVPKPLLAIQDLSGTHPLWPM